jgi:hypothetical protein
VNLKSCRSGSGMKIEEYIDAQCIEGTPKVGSQVPIRKISNLSLKIIVLMLTRIIGSAFDASSIDTNDVLCIRVC